MSTWLQGGKFSFVSLSVKIPVPLHVFGGDEFASPRGKLLFQIVLDNFNLNLTISFVEQATC